MIRDTAKTEMPRYMKGCFFINGIGLKVTKKGCPKTAFSNYSQK
jgi:hypothetical protein